nr:NAD(P)H-hydrate epimerase [Actinomycetota bacterium]
MRPLLHPEEMRRADEAAIASGTPAAELMERAGRALARRAVALAGGRYGRRALVLCGKGNNGGDGLVAARVLAGEGLGVECVLLFGSVGDGGAHPAVRSVPFRPGLRVERFDVVIDAIFGTGFRGAPEGDAAAAIELLRGHPAVVSADIPSGVDGATGAVRGLAVRAAATVAMGAEKLGTALAPGAAYAGDVEVADIGIAVGDTSVHLAEDSDVGRVLPVRPPDAHKRSGGAVAVLAGAEGTRGAAILCCRGAERMGAGYVTLVSEPSVIAAANVAVPEVLTRERTDGDPAEG